MNKDGSVNMYLYNYGENKPFIDREFPHTFDRNEVYELAIILNSVMDKNGVFDRAINDYNSDIVITDKEKLEFENHCIITRGDKK